jgi:hypothetical protein
MFRIKLSCTGIDPSAGETAARDIETEFREHRPWHHDVTCRFEDGRLILCATNDFDDAGLALQDEFSDCLCAYVEPFDGDLRVLSVDAV